MIIDASVAFKLIVPEAGSEAAGALAAEADLHAPILLHAEVANALWKMVRRGQLQADGVGLRLASLDALITFVDEGAVAPRALEIAIELDHPAYDCVYLAVAEMLDAPFVTADERLQRKLADTPWNDRIRRLP